ncbi:MAG TPA: hypothetical protein EYP41_16190 [Anaerolineae bacterium]|nr:hypothetical protein [Anaerolineae bacterium]HIP73650.1 hypothetical protein [Anaerolineae bacterium]
MTNVTELTAVQFTAEVSRQQHAMAGAVIALSAAQAAALGQACLQISRDRLGLADLHGNFTTETQRHGEKIEVVV